MNADELEIYELLKSFPNVYVSVTEISKKVGKGRKFDLDRTWARPILRRMEMDGLLEANPFGEYRVRASSAADIDFKEALKTPGVSLGDTTIIKISDLTQSDTESKNKAVGH
jgi:hypothetical protein